MNPRTGRALRSANRGSRTSSASPQPKSVSSPVGAQSSTTVAGIKAADQAAALRQPQTLEDAIRSSPSLPGMEGDALVSTSKKIAGRGKMHEDIRKYMAKVVAGTGTGR